MQQLKFKNEKIDSNRQIWRNTYLVDLEKKNLTHLTNNLVNCANYCKLNGVSDGFMLEYYSNDRNPNDKFLIHLINTKIESTN